MHARAILHRAASVLYGMDPADDWHRVMYLQRGFVGTRGGLAGYVGRDDGGGCILRYPVYTALGMLLRCSKEDALMRKQFEKQWDEWAGRVRYRLIPFVY